MARIGSIVAFTLAGAMLLPRAALAQNADHEPGTAPHSHAMAAVDCTTLASPPWNGLAEVDRERWTGA